VASQPGRQQEDEAERADAREVVAEQRFEPAGVGGLLGGAPVAEKCVDAVSHGIVRFSGVAQVGEGRPACVLFSSGQLLSSRLS
jgi:hypothetical protein